jgi:hypothetical protein
MESVLEEKLISCCKVEMISFLQSHPEYFEEAVQLAISHKQPFSWRAAFLLWGCMEDNDSRIHKHIGSIINSIKDKKDGHQRELLKILYRMDIKKKYEGQIFDICMNLWEQISKDPSVRMTALKFILKISKKHPELLKEMTFLTQDHYLASLSPGVKKSIQKMMQEVIEVKSDYY